MSEASNASAVERQLRSNEKSTAHKGAAFFLLPVLSILIYNPPVRHTILSNELREARVACGLSQQALAAAAGLPQSHISKIERGGDAQITTVRRIARVLGCDIVLAPRRANNALSPSAIEALRHPRPGSKVAAAKDFGIDLLTLARNAALTPSERLREATRPLPRIAPPPRKS